MVKCSGSIVRKWREASKSPLATSPQRALRDFPEARATNSGETRHQTGHGCFEKCLFRPYRPRRSTDANISQTAPLSKNNPSQILGVVEEFFLSVYLLELLLRFFGAGWKCLRSKWVFFDMVLVVCGVMSEWIAPLAFGRRGGAGAGGPGVNGSSVAAPSPFAAQSEGEPVDPVTDSMGLVRVEDWVVFGCPFCRQTGLRS